MAYKRPTMQQVRALELQVALLAGRRDEDVRRSAAATATATARLAVARQLRETAKWRRQYEALALVHGDVMRELLIRPAGYEGGYRDGYMAGKREQFEFDHPGRPFDPEPVVTRVTVRRRWWSFGRIRRVA